MTADGDSWGWADWLIKSGTDYQDIGKMNAREAARAEREARSSYLAAKARAMAAALQQGYSHGYSLAAKAIAMAIALQPRV